MQITEHLYGHKSGLTQKIYFSLFLFFWEETYMQGKNLKLNKLNNGKDCKIINKKTCLVSEVGIFWRT